MPISQIASDGDNNALFPSPGAGKNCTAADGTTLVSYATGSGAATLAYDGSRWTRGATLPLVRPYIVLDSAGFVHLFGLREVERRQQVWHFQSAAPHRIDRFDEGECVYAKNYSAATIDPDDTLYYFGAALEGFGFRKKPRGGSWTETRALATGHCIYPGVAWSAEVLHLVFCGWNRRPALYEGVFYMKSGDRGETWTRSDGTPLNLPVDKDSEEIEMLSLTQSHGSGEANTHILGVMADRDEKAHVLYWYSRPYAVAFGTAAGHEPEPNVRVKHVRRDPDGWKYNHLCDALNHDVGYAVMAQAASGRLTCVITHKESLAPFFDLGYVTSDDNGDHWSPIQPITGDANERRLSYAHPAINRTVKDGKVQFVCNVWSGKQPSPIYYGEIDVAS